MRMDEYEVINNLKGGSLASVELIKRDGKTFVRKEASAVKSKYAFQKLQEQFTWIKNHQHLSPKIPTLTKSGFVGKDLFYYEMDYYESLGFFEFIHSRPIAESKKILGNVLDFCFQELYKPIKQPSVDEKKKLAKRLVDEKLFTKLDEGLSLSKPLRDLQAFDKIYVNHEEYLNFWPAAEKLMQANFIDKIADYTAFQIHGDTTVEDVLCTKDSFVLVDPNPENIVNCRLVDVTKMSQSLTWGFEFLNASNDCQILGNQIIYNDNTSVQYAQLKGFFWEKVNSLLTDEEKTKVNLFDALNYSRLLPIRMRINPKTGPIYYGVLVKILNKALEELA